jgi:hypothetical protein
LKGDFTRLTLAGRKRFHKVLMQQGRVQLDQDWNEQMEILARRWELQTRDMIGNSGVPAENPGLGISYDAATQRLLLSPGRLYIDGLLCEAFAEDGDPLSLTSQPFLKSTAGPLWQPPVDTDRLDLIYVKAWERHISAVEDESLLEPALGGADTTTRTQVVWQVLPFAAPVDATADSEIPGWAELTAAPTGTLSARTQGPTVEGAGYLPDGGGYRGLENRLYRVEVHTGGDLSQATFKWSRDNGSVAARVEEIHGALVTVASLGRDPFSGLAPGQWVEVIDDEHEFAEGKGLLAQILSVREADRILELSAEVGAYGGTNARVRRWDMVTAGAVGAVAMTGDWQELELGLQVKFWPGTYRTGDYWTCAARAATATIEPVGTEAAGEAPHGQAYRYYKLALARWTWLMGNQPSDPPVLTCQIEDLRYHFPALATPPKKEILQSTVFVAPGADFTLRLQQAIQSLPDGGEITLAAGYFRLDQPLVIDGRRRIAIRGAAGATRLLYEASNNTLPALVISNCVEVELDGIALYGRNARVLIRAENTRGLHLTDCRLACFSPEGIALFAPLNLTGLSLENTTVRAAVGIAAAGILAQTTIRNSGLYCLRAGITATQIEGLAIAQSTVAPATADMLDIAALTPENLRWVDTPVPPEPSAVGMPAGIVANVGTDWSLTDVRIAAGLALGALSLTGLDLRESEILALRGLLTLSSTGCTVTGCRFATENGSAVTAFGNATEWNLEGNTLTGKGGTVRFGPISRETAWVGRIGRFFNQNAAAWVLAADNILTGFDPAGVPSLTESAWLSEALKSVTDALTTSIGSLGGVNGTAAGIRVHHNLLTAVHFSTQCQTERLQITGNQFSTVPGFNLRVEGVTTDRTLRSVMITDNLLDTEGLPVSVDVAGATIARNRIRLLHRDGDRQDALAAAAALLLSANPEARAIGTALQQGGDRLCQLLQTKASQLDQGINLGDLKADFTAAANACRSNSLGRRLAALFAQEYKTAASASRTLLLWGDVMATAIPRPAIRSSNAQVTIAENQITGDATAAGSILLDLPRFGEGNVHGISVKGNRLSGAMTGHGILGLAPLGQVTVADNQTEGMGGIVLAWCQDAVITGNQVTLAAGEGADWGVYKRALLVNRPSGLIRITGNQLVAGGFGALFLGEAYGYSALVTGNTLTGFQQNASSLAELTDPNASLVLAQNHVTYRAPKLAYAVNISAKRAAITGNVWMEDDEALPLNVVAETYTVVGNVSTKELPDTDSAFQKSQLNTHSPNAYPSDPQVLIATPWAGDTITSAVAVSGTAHDRNAGSEDRGVDVCSIYRIGLDGSQVALGNAAFSTADTAPVGSFSFNWNPAADNTPYGDYYLSAYAHSTVHDITQASPRVQVSVKPEFPGDPEVAITAPASGTFNPGTIAISGTARDRNATGGTAGIESVSLYLDGDQTSGTFLGTAQLQSTGAWTYNWSTGDKVGVHTITAVARSRRSALKKASAPLKVTLTAQYPTDPMVTINTPSYDNMHYTGNLTVIGTAVDRNSSTPPGVEVKILVRTGASTTPVEMGTATFGTDGFWTFELNTVDMAGPCTIIAAAHSLVQNVTHTAERSVIIDYPDDPQIEVTSTFGSGGTLGGDPSGALSLKSGTTSLASGSTGGSGGTYAYFQGWAYDRNAVTGHGIQEIRVYENVNGTDVLRGTASIGLTSPVDAHWGHRYANCGWQFSYAVDTGDTTYIVAPTYSVTLIFEAVSAVSGQTIRTTGFWTNSGAMSS